MKRRVGLGVLAVVVIVGASATWYRIHHEAAAPKSTTQAPARPPQAKPAALDPLEIPAIRARGYKASPITPTQALGNQGGYTNAVVSFVSDVFTEYALQSTPTTAAPAGGYPVIILMHGYIAPTQYQTTGSDYHDLIAAWARAGFMVIKPDYRGVGHSQGTATSGHYAPDGTAIPLTSQWICGQTPEKARRALSTLAGFSEPTMTLRGAVILNHS